MNKFGVLLLLLGLVGICWSPPANSESWEEFVRLKKRAETPRLIPKGGLKPRLLRKDIVIRQIIETGQVNLGAESSGDPSRPDITSEALLFEFGLPVLRSLPENDRNIRTIVAAIKELGDRYPHYYVDGHTCDIGTEENNCRLSWSRARTIYDRLVSEGIEPRALTMRGFGENTNTVRVPNTSEENRKLNRRVVLIAYGSGAGSKWPEKDIGVIAGPAAGATNDKARFMCSDSLGGEAAHAGSSDVGGMDAQGTLSEDIDWETSDKLERAAKEMYRQADIAAGHGDTEKAEALREGAMALENRAIETLAAKGGKRLGIPRGFRSLNTKSPTPIRKGRSGSRSGNRGDIPAGFKPVR